MTSKAPLYAPAIFILLITSLYYIPISAQGISTSAPNPLTDNSAGLLYLLIFVSVIVVLYKLTHRKRKRRAFASDVRRKTLEKQHYKCANCKRPLKPRETDYHHKNGNRSDNKGKNCQVLCPNCHADKTRR
jgi:DNA-directed RNA polymerase subunit RPC12/RpoP